MKRPVIRNLTLSLVGLGALLVYILACTSFSPDDSKVLYVTVDAKCGLDAVAVYDRKTAKSEVLFEPFGYNQTNYSSELMLLRPQWLEGGHDFLATWTPGGDNPDPCVNLAVLPYDQRGPARFFRLPAEGKNDSMWFYYWPVAVAGKTLFWNGESNTTTRLNLETGEMHRWTNRENLVLLSSTDNDRFLYLLEADSGQSGFNEVGLFNPKTFNRTPLFQIKDRNASAISLAMSRDGRRLAYQVDGELPAVLHLLELGTSERTISLASLGEQTEIMLHQFSPNGEMLYGSFKDSSSETGVDYGVVEISVDGSTTRKTRLITGAETGSKDDLFASFQVDLSHDGRTLAVESLWLAYSDHPVKAEDCALFLVDLGDPQRKVTKVPIPLPAKNRPPLIK